MKVGDLVKFKVPRHVAGNTSPVEEDTIGLVIYLDGTWAKVSWNFQDGAVGRNFRHDLEVISESSGS